MSDNDDIRFEIEANISYAVGRAYVIKHVNGNNTRVFCFLQDEIMQDGVLWEAADFTGWSCLVVEDTHYFDTVEDFCKNLEKERISSEQKPTLIILPRREFRRSPKVGHHPKRYKAIDQPLCLPDGPAEYQIGQNVATTEVYALALLKLGKICKQLLVLDGDVQTDTMTYIFQKAYPDRFIECFMAEQNMVGIAVGAAKCNKIVFATTFTACFLRSYAQIRDAVAYGSNINLCGTHCGCFEGQEGALEDLAVLRAIPNLVIFYPSDAVATERAMQLAINSHNVTFIRTTSQETPVIYPKNERFHIGRAKVVRQTPNDAVTVIGCCVTLVEALRAADFLALEKIFIRVIDPFTVKPLDISTILESARATGGRVITVEDHYPQGGIGDAVCSALSEEPNTTVLKLAVGEIPGNGRLEQLLQKYRIDSEAIVQAVRYMLGDKPKPNFVGSSE